MKLTTAAKENFLLSDGRVQLRILRREDINERYLSWMSDPVVNRYSQWRFYSLSMEDLISYADSAWKNPNALFCTIKTSDANRHIGNIKLTVDPYCRTGEISILIGEKECWGKGYATAAIGLLADYALTSLHLRKVYGGAYSTNVGSIRAFEKAGFKVEARMERHFLCDLGEVDGVFFARFAQAPSH